MGTLIEGYLPKIGLGLVLALSSTFYADLCTGLRLVLSSNKQYEFLCIWITACVVLHNILLGLDDAWTKDEGCWTEEDNDKYVLSLTPQ